MHNTQLVVGYLRLSENDLEKKYDYSKSIYNQSQIIHEYAKKLGLRIDDEYIDDGYSGIHFDRPEFGRLLEDVRAGKVAVVITKDISRLGREFVETAYYISEYFTKYHVRYIAINDQYDSINSNSEYMDIMLKIRSIMNDRYVKDISNKRKQVAQLQTHQGNFLGPLAPYGYKIVKKHGKRSLEIDEQAAEIVKRIFSSITNGKTRIEIAMELNAEKVPPPIVYMNMTYASNRKYFLDWSDQIIYRILTNKTYIGRLVIRKSIKTDYKQKKRDYIYISKRETIENTHPAIVSESLFKEANSKLRMIKKRRSSINKCNRFFYQKVMCGECGKIMTLHEIVNNNKKVYYWKCGKITNRKKCINRVIYDSKLRNISLHTITKLINDFVDEKDIFKRVEKYVVPKYTLKVKERNIKQNIELCDYNIHKLYMKKVSGEIDLDTFLCQKKIQIDAKKNYECKLLQINDIYNKKKDNNIKQYYRDFLRKSILSAESLEYLVNKIIIYNDGVIQFSFKFHIGNRKES